jgi:hypothetical protein
MRKNEVDAAAQLAGAFISALQLLSSGGLKLET